MKPRSMKLRRLIIQYLQLQLERTMNVSKFSPFLLLDVSEMEIELEGKTARLIESLVKSLVESLDKSSIESLI